MKNFLTDKEINGQESITIDGKYLPSKEYTHCCRILKKSRLDSADVIYALDLEYRLKTKINILLNLVRKISQETKIKDYKILENIIQKESILALKFKRNRDCLTREQHLEIMNEVISSLKEYQKIQLIGNNTSEEFLQAYNTFEYLNYQ